MPARHGDETARTTGAEISRPVRPHINMLRSATMMSSIDSTTKHRQQPNGRVSVPKLPNERALLDELWRISDFVDIAHATLLRSLTISAGHQIADAALAGA